MGVSIQKVRTGERVIDLRGHRLGELVQVLTGCSTERAELAVGDLAPGAVVDEPQALEVLATALVRVRGPRRTPSPRPGTPTSA